MAQPQAMSPLSIAFTYFLLSSPTLITRGEHEGSLNSINQSQDSQFPFQRSGPPTETGQKKPQANHGGDTPLHRDHDDPEQARVTLRSDRDVAANSIVLVPSSLKRDPVIQAQGLPEKTGRKTRLLRGMTAFNPTAHSPRLTPKTPSRLRLNSRYSYPAHEPSQIGTNSPAGQGVSPHPNCDQNNNATGPSSLNQEASSPDDRQNDREFQPSKNMINLHEPRGKAEYHTASVSPLPKPFTSWNPTTPRLNPIPDMDSPSPIVLPSPQLKSGFFAISMFGSEQQFNQGSRMLEHTSPLACIQQMLGDNSEDSSLHSQSGPDLDTSMLASPIAQSTPWTSIPLSPAMVTPQSNLGLGLGLCLSPTPAPIASSASGYRPYDNLIDPGFYLLSSSSISYPFPQVPHSPSHVPDAAPANPDSNVGQYWSLTPKEAAFDIPTTTTPPAGFSSPRHSDSTYSRSRTRAIHPGMSPRTTSERPEELYVTHKASNPPMSPVFEHAVAMVSPIFGRLPAPCSVIAGAVTSPTTSSPKGKQKKAFPMSSPLLRSYF